MGDGWDEDTGVTDVPKLAQSVSARAAFREIRELGKKFDKHAESDQAELKSINTTLSDLRASSSGTQSALEAMTDELRHRRGLERLRSEAEATGQVVKVTSRGRIWLAVIGVVGTLAGALSAWLAK
jgi:chromosome segregation ATPase